MEKDENFYAKLAKGFSRRKSNLKNDEILD